MSDELDKLLRKWRLDVTYSPHDRPQWLATAWMYAPAPNEWGRTPLSAARKLARRLEKEESCKR